MQSQLLCEKAILEIVSEVVIDRFADHWVDRQNHFLNFFYMRALTTNEQIFTGDYREPVYHIPLKISRLEKQFYVWVPESKDEYVIPLQLQMTASKFVDGHGTLIGKYNSGTVHRGKDFSWNQSRPEEDGDNILLP